MRLPRLRIAVLATTALAFGCSGGQGPYSDVPVQTCSPGTTPPQALVEAGTPGVLADGSVVLPGGRRLSPLGGQWTGVGGFPIALHLLDQGRYLLVSDAGIDDDELTLFDSESGQQVQQFTFAVSQGESLFFGLAVTSDEKTVYVSGGGDDTVYVFRFDPTDQTAPLSHDPLADLHATPPGTSRGLRDYLGGLALTPDGKYLYAAAQLNDNGNVDVFDPTMPSAPIYRFPLGMNPTGGDWDIAMAPAGSGRKEAYVSLVETGKLAVLDLTNEAQPVVSKEITVGKNPERVQVVPDATDPGFRLFVAVTDESTLAEIDPGTGTVVDSIPVSAQKEPPGMEPDDFAFTPDGSRLLVSDAGENAISVLRTSDWSVVGQFPVAWWPTAIAIDPQTSRIYVANGKGDGIGARTMGQGISEMMKGTISVIDHNLFDATNDQSVTAETEVVRQNNTRPASLQTPLSCDDPQHPAFPIPQKAGDPTPIKHVIFVVRENKTYDSELGDLPNADGDPSLTIWGPRYTPNTHALAKTFDNMDNFYDDSEQSVQGHVWTTSSATNAYVETEWMTLSGWGRGTLPAGEAELPPFQPGGGYIWQNLDANNISYADEGEIVGINTAKQTFDLSYGVWDLDVHDSTSTPSSPSRASLLYAKWFDPTQITEPLPTFSYVTFINDHTFGTQPGKPTPESMVEDNDEATGKLVDYVSHSSYWPSTAIFIVEDDPSDGGDHVEAHRSLCLVVSPWVRRGFTSHTNYDYASVYHTMEAIVGMPPMGIYDANAALMNDLFTRTPDYTPYTYIPRSDPETLNSSRARGAARSMAIDFSQPDTSLDLSRILWLERTGTEAPWARPIPVPDADDADDADDANDADDRQATPSGGRDSDGPGDPDDADE
jgi:DNA-binding beta-propeller fold protein YncE